MTISQEKLLYDEIRKLREMLEHIEALLEERLLGMDEPLPDEVEAIREYETDKGEGRVELISLDNVIEKEE